MRVTYWSVAALVGVGVVVCAVLWSVLPHRAGVAILGDHAPALRAALGQPPITDVEDAAVTVVMVEDWSKLVFLGGLGAQAPSPLGQDDWMARVLHLRVSGSSKVVYLNLSQWLQGDEGLDTGCLARIVAREWAGLGQHGEQALCAAGLPAPVSRIVLPMGLGTL